ncbi:MAG: substrate-binding domain-containing protein, partial [Spirochaetota bacterium]
SRNDAEREARIMESYLSKNVDGIILTITSDANRTQIERLVERDYPLILLGRHFSDIESYYVAIDNAKVSRDAVEYLQGRGHRKIYFLTLDLKHSPDRERLQGFAAAVARNPSDNCRTILYDGSLKETHRYEVQAKAGYEMTWDLLLKKDLPSAFFASNDYIAMGCMRACYEAGVSIPGEVSLIGAGNMLIPELQIKRLTTFDPHAETMGAIAAGKLCALIEEGKQEAGGGIGGRGTILEMDLVEAETVGKAGI